MNNSDEKNVGAEFVEEGNRKEIEYCCHCKKELTKETKCFGLTISMCKECYDKLSFGE